MSFVVEGAKEWQAAIDGMIAKVSMATKQAVEEGALEIQKSAQEAASGRPGPNVISGALRASIHIEGPVGSGATWEAEIGPSVVYARAIELGLWQAPDIKYPYMEPGLQAAIPKLGAIFQRVWATTVK